MKLNQSVCCGQKPLKSSNRDIWQTNLILNVERRTKNSAKLSSETAFYLTNQRLAYPIGRAV